MCFLHGKSALLKSDLLHIQSAVERINQELNDLVLSIVLILLNDFW